MDLNEFLQAIANHAGGAPRHVDAPNAPRRSEADKTRTRNCHRKLAQMQKYARDTGRSLYDRYGVLASARAQFDAFWPAEWPNAQEHRDYLAACDGAAFDILRATTQPQVLSAWRAVVKPDPCRTTKVGDYGEQLLNSIAEARYFELGLEALAPKEQQAGEPACAE